MFSVKKLLSISLFVPTLAFASSVGIGEYRFGPDTPQNTACEIAEHRAREDAILQFIGEQIESITMNECRNEDCDFQNQIFSEVKGIIKKVINRQREIIKEQGYENCIVTIEAEVEEIKNTINFQVETKTTFDAGERVNFTVLSSSYGIVNIFNFHNDVYHRIGNVEIQMVNRETKFPGPNHQMIAKLPEGTFKSKELMAFVFTKDKVKMKDNYTANEMRNVLSSIDPLKRRVVFRYVTIVRKI
jgi:hypothetical protein